MLTILHDLWKHALEQEVASGYKGWAHTFSFLNLFGYITFRAAVACMIAFVVSLIAGPRVIRKLLSLKMGQPLRTAEEVHKLAELHGGKVGTPTMGGVMILGALLVAVLIAGRLENPFVQVTLVTTLACGVLGFCDDYKKVREKKSDGVSARAKLFWQLVIALGAACFVYFHPSVSGFGVEGAERLNGAGFRLGDQPLKMSEICFPLFKAPLVDLHWLVIPFFVAIIIGCSNAVNLTDGLDGLATGCTITTGLAYAALAYLAGNFFVATEYLQIPHHREVAELAVFLLALVGAGFGFLWFNCHPAKVFMGDTGSLAIGGAFGATAICTKQELLLVIIGGVFVMEALSVILQVGSFKLRKKRIFKMAPIHHHFELLGWHENQVINRFWLISILLGMFGLALLKIV